MANDRREQFIKRDLEDLVLTLYVTPIKSYTSRVIQREIRGMIKANPDYDLSYYHSEMLNILKGYNGG